jgi:phospholipid/cholesterol/gamma-HCH transport system ATP-binding protein
MPGKLRLENLSYAIAGQELLKSVSLEVTEGNGIIIVGKSGSGKSTLLELCAGLLTPGAGRVFWDDLDIATIFYEDMVILRRKTGFVFQLHALISNMSIFENIALPLRYHDHIPEKELRDRVFAQLSMCGIQDIAYRLPEQLSIGQTRLAAIARALINNPGLLFMDEPESGLDPQTRDFIISMILTIKTQHNTTIIMLSHHLETIKQIGLKVVTLEEGRLIYE